VIPAAWLRLFSPAEVNQLLAGGSVAAAWTLRTCVRTRPTPAATRPPRPPCGCSGRRARARCLVSSLCEACLPAAPTMCMCPMARSPRTAHAAHTERISRQPNPSHSLNEAHEQVVASMSADERGLLLRFVTSVSRAPLGGFRHLAPPLTIHRVPCDASPFAAVGARDVDRLPSASTCFNLLARSRWVGAWPCISACWRSPTGSGYGCGFTRGRAPRGLPPCGSCLAHGDHAEPGAARRRTGRTAVLVQHRVRVRTG